MSRAAPYLLAILVVAPVPVVAQAIESGADNPVLGSGSEDDVEASGLREGRPRVRPTRAETPPEIDGRLDDAAWITAARLPSLVQQTPLEGEPASEETDIYLAFDDDHLYLGFHAHYGDPSIMRANRVDRDLAAADDLIRIFLDTFMNQQQGYVFEVNGYGVQGDGTFSRASGGGAIPDPDRTWDTLFDAGGQLVEDGFTAEVAIPFKSLRYPGRGEGEDHLWALQIVREVKGRNGEIQVWSPISRDDPSFFAQMGILEGLPGISTSRNVEILPTITAVQYGEIEPSRRTFVNRGADPDAGVSAKYGITPNMTADFTLNPDFSQIESEEAQIEVNQRFPLFYPELRPFFLEGAEIFRIQAPVTLVHTRTIVDPDWGLKFTGKVGRVALGAVAANDNAPGNVDDPDDPAFGEKAHTIIARGVYDLFSESTLGAIVTSREFLSGYSRLFGLDGDFQLTPTWTFRFRAIQTLNRDPGEDAEEGHFRSLGFFRSGRHVQYDVYGYQISPDLDSDVGFVRRTDVRQAGTSFRYRFWPEDSWVINWGPRVGYLRIYDYEGVLQDESFGLTLDFGLARNVNLRGTWRSETERFLETRFDKREVAVQASVNASRRLQASANLTIGDAVRYSTDPFLARSTRWSVSSTLRPVSRLQTRLDLASSRLTDPRNDDREVFEVRILRSRTDVQLTDRIGLRSIAEFNTLDERLDLNILLNYRVNAGTVFYVGYDDHYQQADLIEGDRDGDGIDDQLFFSQDLRRTNRAIFIKLQYLIRY